MSNYNLTNIEFSRQALLPTIMRPQPALALYPLNASDTRLLVQVISNATVIAIRYISTGTTTESISFVGKSVEAVVQEINQLTLPIKAVTLSNVENLAQGDIISLGTDYVEIPRGFTTYDRLNDRGIVLRTKKFTIRHKNRSRIKIQQPYLEDPSLPWYPRITNGAFSQKYNNKIYHFYIPEFDNQSWSTVYGKPFKDLKGVSPIIVDDNVYQLPRFPVYWHGENVVIYNGDVPSSTNVIEDIDVNNGLIYTRPGSNLQEDFTIDYTYLETTYIYKDVNINGHFSQNPALLEKFVVIYLVPVEGQTSVKKRAVYHAIGDSIDDAINSIVAPDTETPIAIIGAYSISSVMATDKINMLDTRSKGGGLIQVKGPTSPVHYLDSPVESTDVPVEDLYDESYRFFDIGNYDGEPYPGAAAVVVDIPGELQELLPVSDIRRRASKFLAAGVYPLLNFSDRNLPSITGSSFQISCAPNANLSFVYTGVGGSLPLHRSISYSEFTGAGWQLDNYDIASSIRDTGSWSSLDNTLPVFFSETIHMIRVGSQTGAVIDYLKGTPTVGISWEERVTVTNSGSRETPIENTPWVKKVVYDNRDCPTGQLIRGNFSLPPTQSVKEYKNITIHSPYVASGSLTNLLTEKITEIIDNFSALQNESSTLPYGTDVVSTYRTVGDLEDLGDESDYVLSPSIYTHLFNLERTPLEDAYRDLIHGAGADFLSGCYTSGQYLKAYSQTINEYVETHTDTPYIVLEFTTALRNLNRYLAYRNRTSTWSGDCTLGAMASTGLVSTLMSSSGTYGSFGPGVPIQWTYFPSGQLFSGVYIPTVDQLGGSISEILTGFNRDPYYNVSLPTVFSTVLAHTGTNLSARSSRNLIDAYNITVNQTIANISGALYNTRTESGLPTTTHWFVGHNRLGGFLGNALINMTRAYDHVYEYNRERSNIYGTTTPTGASTAFLSHMFSGIEQVLYAASDAVFHNVSRGGIVESDIAYALYGYGWYLNNWEKNYGITSKTYTRDYRSMFESIFDHGLSRLIKNHFTEDGEMYEGTYIKNQLGPFPVSTTSKILYPLAQGLEHDYCKWAGVAHGVVHTLANLYSQDGLYYNNPYRQTAEAGKQLDVLGGLSSMYKAVAATGEYDSWEPIHSSLDTVRGVNFYPVMNSVTGWEGNQNSLAFWKYYHSGDVESELSYLRGYGINTLRVQLDYLYWKHSGVAFRNKFQHLLNSAADNRLRVIPVFFQGEGTSVPTGQATGYVNIYGHTGGPYFYQGLNSRFFMTGSFYSGAHYVTSIVSGFDSHPAILAWDVCNQSNSNATSYLNYNAAAYLIDQITTTPITISTSKLNTYYEFTDLAAIPLVEIDPNFLPIYDTDIYGVHGIAQNPRFDILGAQPENIFDYLVDKTYVSAITGYYMLTNLGNGTYADYELAIARAEDRGLPYILSNIMVRTGSNEGALYYDNSARSSRQLGAIINSAYRDGVITTGVPSQRRNFSNFPFYPYQYVPSYTVVNLLAELDAWGTRTYDEPLTDLNTGEFYRQVDVLSSVQSGLDILNHQLYNPNDYYVDQVLSVTECSQLNYYRNTWSGANFFAGASPWIDEAGGDIDRPRYDDFITAWGRDLAAICRRLEIDG